MRRIKWRKKKELIKKLTKKNGKKDYPKSNRKAIINANRATASESANPKIAYVNNWPFNEGLRAYPMIRDPKTVPIPAPDPATPTVAAPAPISLAASNILKS